MAEDSKTIVTNETLGRFGHHPDPATDFETEVNDIECEVYHHKVGFENGTPPLSELADRIFKAMMFRVGAVETAVLAKQWLRELEKEVAAMLRAAPELPARDSKLLPCPFCGGDVERRHNQFHGDMSMVSCRNCGATAYDKKWNRRAAPVNASMGEEPNFAACCSSTDVSVCDCVNKNHIRVDYLPSRARPAVTPRPSSELVAALRGMHIGEFKPCVIVNDDARITECVFEDVAYIAEPVFPGVYHWIDKYLAMDDRRVVGMAVWATLPALTTEGQTAAAEVRALEWDDAVTLARKAIYDTDGRGMVGRGRNHLDERVARALIHHERRIRSALVTAAPTTPGKGG